MLPHHFGPNARILDLVGRDAGPLVGGDIAHNVAARLMPCMPTLARSAMASGNSSSLIQWYWMFCRVVKWP